MNKRLAIKGHPTRGKEVVEILEMLGGTNSESCWGVFDNRLYTINAFGVIEDKSSRDISNYQVYTLEEFLEKLPYRVGDKVYIKVDPNANCLGSEKIYGVIESAVWFEKFGHVVYKLKDCSGMFYREDLQPYKEETMESKPNLLQQLKEYFDNTPRDVLEKEWHEYDKYNEIGPTVNEYLEYVNKSRQPQYPKTYEECCDILYIETNRTIEDDDCLGYRDITPYDINLLTQLRYFRKLLICRDAYWKIAGEQMGLGKPWEPKWEIDNVKYSIIVVENEIRIGDNEEIQRLLVFPTEEMRDTFYENFKKEIEQCKELL